ncbi:MAG: DNA polymerase III subunit alpha [Gemmatimonadota bacterium]
MFTHLHVHTHFSFGRGASSPDALIAAALERGFATLACTDTNGVYGAVEFQQTAESAGLRPILGAHLVAGGQEAVVLAEDDRGWAALCRAVSRIHWAGHPGTIVGQVPVPTTAGWPERTGGGRRRTLDPASIPQSDPRAIHRGERSSPEESSGRSGQDPAEDLADQLAADRDGLVVLSSDIALLERVHRLSGPVGLYAELIPGKARHAVLAAARRLGIPPVVSGAVHFAHPEDWARHRLLRAIGLNTTLSALSATEVSGRDAWLRPTDEIERHFPDCPEAVTRATEVAERCRYRIPIGRIVAPRLADQSDALGQLRTFAYEGARRRYGTVARITRDRIEHELTIIALKGFADYFLVVRDIVAHGPTHCGRGSVANSIVAYCLGITHVDPLASGLLFERFLNPERTDPPDIDLDFPWDERDHVLGYVFRRYPHPQAAMVCNHNCFRLRGAIREVARVHGRPNGEIREVTRRIPWFSDEPLEQLLETHPNYSELDLPAAWRDYARMAQPLVGVPRHLSLHPGGVVIVPNALTDFVPTQPAVKTLDGSPDLTVPAIQFEKDGAEDAGLVKIDLLGNRSLAVIRDAMAMVARNTGVALDYTSSEAGEDSATRALFRAGKTMGVFYTESPASRLLCRKSQAESFELLVLNTSIIRPASNRFIRTYLERLHGAPYQPLDPCLRDTLSDTFGVMVFQEDVVNVCASFAGMPLSTGDGLRKALSKKRPVKHLAGYAEEFFAGAATLGRDPDVSRQVWEMVMSFAGYSFCKGHSCSYIQVAQQSCFLRAHYPAEFFAAVLANGGGFYRPFAYVAEAWREGARVLGPDVNQSEFRTTGAGDALRIGFQFLKGLSADAVDRIERADRPFADLEDLRRRTGLQTDDLRILIKAGALDAIAGGRTRPMLLWAVDAERMSAAERHSPNATMADILPAPRIPELPEYRPERRREEEQAALGFPIDAHPMTLHADRLRRFRLCPSTDLANQVGQTVLCAGMLTTAKPVTTAKHEPMEFATFDDGHGLMETVLFPDVYRNRGHLLFDQGPFIFRGKVEEEFGAVTVTITHLDRLERMLAKLARGTPHRAVRTRSQRSAP